MVHTAGINPYFPYRADTWDSCSASSVWQLRSGLGILLRFGKIDGNINISVNTGNGPADIAGNPVAAGYSRNPEQTYNSSLWPPPEISDKTPGNFWKPQKVSAEDNSSVWNQKDPGKRCCSLLKVLPLPHNPEDFSGYPPARLSSLLFLFYHSPDNPLHQRLPKAGFWYKSLLPLR